MGGLWAQAAITGCNMSKLSSAGVVSKKVWVFVKRRLETLTLLTLSGRVHNRAVALSKTPFAAQKTPYITHTYDADIIFISYVS